MYINHRCRSCCAIIPMNVFGNRNALMVQRRRNCAIITMNVFYNIHALMVQRRMCYANIPMNVFCNMNALMVQRRRNCAIITVDVFAITNVTTTQLGTSCSFDSPGLARNEPTPGKRLQGDSTP